MRRVVNNFNGPINHLSRKEVSKIFADELTELKALRERVRQKAIELGYDPEEPLTDVKLESNYE